MMFFHLTWSHRVSSALSKDLFFNFIAERFLLLCVIAVKRKKLDGKFLSSCLMMKNWVEKNFNCCQLWQSFQLAIFHPQTPFPATFHINIYSPLPLGEQENFHRLIFFRVRKFKGRKNLINFFRFWFSNSSHKLKILRGKKWENFLREFIKV
jgi:hypothetical protein